MLTIHPIYLEKVRPSLYIGRIEPGHLQEWEFYLAVRSQMPESKLIEAVPGYVRISSYDVLNTDIESALPGVLLTYIAKPPLSIPTRLGFCYFKLETTGVYWEGIKDSKVLAVRVPESIPDEKLEMYGVRVLKSFW